MLLVLLLVASLFVACQDDPETPVDTSGEGTTTNDAAEDTTEGTTTTGENTTTEGTTTEGTTTEGTTTEGTTTEGTTTEGATTDGTTTKDEDESTTENSTTSLYNTNNFTSDVASETVNTLGGSILATQFAFSQGGEPTTPQSSIANGQYIFYGFSKGVTKTNGYYAFTTELADVGNTKLSMIFVRGIENFNFGDGSYYGCIKNNGLESGTDTGYAGCGGIYLNTVDEGLNTYLVIRFNCFDGTEVTFKEYRVRTTSKKITVIDKEDGLYILSGDGLAAKIVISGTKDYQYVGQGNAVVGATDCAESVVISTAAGVTNETVANAIVASSHCSDIGYATRLNDGQLKIFSYSLTGSDVATVPTEFMTEAAEVIPQEGDPSFIMNANKLVTVTGTAMTVAPGEGFTTLKATGGDCYFSLFSSQEYAGKIIAIKYKTSYECEGQLFVGTDKNGSPNGTGDNINFEYTSDGEWHLKTVDVSTVSSVTGDTLGFLRYDFFTNGMKDGVGQSIDVEYIAVFKTVAEAEAYEAKLHPTTTPEA